MNEIENPDKTINDITRVLRLWSYEGINSNNKDNQIKSVMKDDTVNTSYVDNEN